MAKAELKRMARMNYNEDTQREPSSYQSKIQAKIQKWLYFSSFIDLFAASLIIPVFGAHLRSLGFGHTLIGALGSVYGGAQFISGPILGSWGDSHGRKNILYVILFTCSICYLSLAFVQSVYVIILLRVLLGCVKHTQTICKTLVADAVAIDKQAETHARLGAFASLGFTVGPIIAGHVSELENGFLYLCSATGSFFLINGLTVLCFFPDCEETNSVNRKFKQEGSEHISNSAKSGERVIKTSETKNKWIKSEDANISTSSNKNIRNKKSLNVIKNSNIFKSSVFRIVKDLTSVEWNEFWDVFAIKFIHTISLSLFFNNYYLFAETMFGISSKHIGYLISVQSLASALFVTQIKHFHGLYSRSTSYIRKIAQCFIVTTLSLFGILIAPGVWTYALFLIFLNGCTALMRILITELLLNRTLPEHRGSIMGAGNSINSAARFVTPLLVGVIQEHYGTSQVVVVSSSFAILGSILSLAMDKFGGKIKKTKHN